MRQIRRCPSSAPSANEFQPSSHVLWPRTQADKVTASARTAFPSEQRTDFPSGLTNGQITRRSDAEERPQHGLASLDGAQSGGNRQPGTRRMIPGRPHGVPPSFDPRPINGRRTRAVDPFSAARAGPRLGTAWEHNQHARLARCPRGRRGGCRHATRRLHTNLNWSRLMRAASKLFQPQPPAPRDGLFGL